MGIVSLDRFFKKKRPRKLRGASHRRHLSALCPSANSSSTQSIIIGPASVSLPTIKTRTNTLESLSHINQSTAERVLIFFLYRLFFIFPLRLFVVLVFLSVASFIFFFTDNDDETNLAKLCNVGGLVALTRNSGKFN